MNFNRIKKIIYWDILILLILGTVGLSSNLFFLISIGYYFWIVLKNQGKIGIYFYILQFVFNRPVQRFLTSRRGRGGEHGLFDGTVCGHHEIDRVIAQREGHIRPRVTFAVQRHDGAFVAMHRHRRAAEMFKIGAVQNIARFVFRQEF